MQMQVLTLYMDGFLEDQMCDVQAKTRYPVPKMLMGVSIFQVYLFRNNVKNFLNLVKNRTLSSLVLLQLSNSYGIGIMTDCVKDPVGERANFFWSSMMNSTVPSLPNQEYKIRIFGGHKNSRTREIQDLTRIMLVCLIWVEYC